MPKRKPTDSAELKLRLRESTRAAIEKAAKKRGRSLNQELVDRLEWSLEQDRIISETDKAIVDRFADRRDYEDVISRALLRRRLEETGAWTPGHDPGTRIIDEVLRGVIARWFWWIGGRTQERMQVVLDTVDEVDRAIDARRSKGGKS